MATQRSAGRSPPPIVPVFRCRCGKLHRTLISRFTPCRDCGECAIYEWNGNPDGVCERDLNVGFDVLCDQAVAALIRLRHYTNDRGAMLDMENTLSGLHRIDEARAGFDLSPLMTAARCAHRRVQELMR